jgi:hypothetical protein
LEAKWAAARYLRDRAFPYQGEIFFRHSGLNVHQIAACRHRDDISRPCGNSPWKQQFGPLVARFT